MDVQQLMNILRKAPANAPVAFVIAGNERANDQEFVISTADIHHVDNGDGVEVEVLLG